MWSSFSIGPRSATAMVPVLSAGPALLSFRWQACSSIPTELRLRPRASARATNSRRGIPLHCSCSTSRSTSVRLLTRVLLSWNCPHVISCRRSPDGRLAEPVPQPVVSPNQWEEPRNTIEEGDGPETTRAQIGNVSGTGKDFTHSAPQVGGQRDSMATVPHSVVDPIHPPSMRQVVHRVAHLTSPGVFDGDSLQLGKGFQHVGSQDARNTFG